MKKRIAIPTVISSLRIAALPPFLYFFNVGNTFACLAIFVLCVITDYFDGQLARKLQATSRFGTFFDVTTDFIFIFGAFAIFYLQGYYPDWLLIIIVASFVQFIITSYYSKKPFDPVGRYLGSALYIGIVLTLLWPIQFIFIFVQVAFIMFFLVSVVSRILSLSKSQKLTNQK